MKFIQVDNSIHCVRVFLKSHKEIEEFVVGFDERLDCIPPHVEGLLTPEETEALSAWLNERTKLQEELEEKPLGLTVLETLPNLLQSSADALDSLDAIDKQLLKQIKQGLIRLDLKLSYFHKLSEEDMTEINTMKDEEVLKTQLESIKQKV